MMKDGQSRRYGLLLLVLMVLANFITYFFKIMRGRMLTVEEFGKMNAQFLWVLIISLPIDVVTAITAR